MHREWWHKFLPLDKLRGYCRNWRATHKSPVSSADREESEVSSGEASVQEKSESQMEIRKDEDKVQEMNGGIPSNKMSCDSNADIEELPSICDEDSSERRSEKGDDASSSSSSDDKQEARNRKWMVPWHWQFLVLAHRNFKQTRKSLLLSWMLWVQVSSRE